MNCYEVTFRVYKHRTSYTHTVSVWATGPEAAAEILSRQLRDPHEVLGTVPDPEYAGRTITL